MTLKTNNLSYWYSNNPDDYLFRKVNLEFEKGKVYAILGQSGSGKTTFLSLLAGLDSPKEGEILLDNQNINQSGLNDYRRNAVSTIFQSYNLLPYMTARQNVETALDISGIKLSDDEVTNLFNSVGISETLIDKPVLQLSGGQQQRVAIVRALAVKHDIIIADEPTGNLDEETTKDIVAIFKNIAHEQNKIVIIVTHEREVATSSDIIFELARKQFTLKQ
ncbi:ABC transporter ATP-binding protein [Streptococcus ratti]|uniref:ABC transporter, ATP-binding protein n=1 Tax=Streptococcus ratti FA-1 = DSM 20564 TaxID=699248 RepID=A0ABP2QXZ8_STRRT|nr:ABC transporter ATP-binding protein [Streptococcus ratti]EJN93930.1 putative ABC transporter, ATP-binding protein [Streptococcus ratti FA-1 = DSM 20564]EMP69661.1 ABC transporter ATP-binding protein [Streptococcus ratti FA-1 = DSM 20564]QEY07773.1 ABC transporter ATP-binding protein [Streptococcus ratti]VEI60239.1 ABC transporter ATP-binding protein [Streptococcus mutans]